MGKSSQRFSLQRDDIISDIETSLQQFLDVLFRVHKILSYFAFFVHLK